MLSRTPDEIKQGLMCLMSEEELDDTCGGCAYLDTCGPCVDHVLPDALALIRQLQAENAEKDARIQQLEAERDAVMRDMTKNCFSCKYAGYNNPGSDGCPYVEQCQNYVKWQWRGVQKEDQPNL